VGKTMIPGTTWYAFIRFPYHSGFTFVKVSSPVLLFT